MTPEQKINFWKIYQKIKNPIFKKQFLLGKLEVSADLEFLKWANEELKKSSE